jgi:hypothetical protein
MAGLSSHSPKRLGAVVVAAILDNSAVSNSGVYRLSRHPCLAVNQPASQRGRDNAMCHTAYSSEHAWALRHPLVLLNTPDAAPAPQQKLPLVFAASSSNVPINRTAIAADPNDYPTHVHLHRLRGCRRGYKRRAKPPVSFGAKLNLEELGRTRSGAGVQRL